ncbi:hypothetical protein P9228_16990 [Mesorhizobium sp. WSM4898]|uniref:hypothetical protein n=1 Tax=Mesorhizobium sp. WSM4898 TaxID=3038544 RepID=UPI00241534B7|nr:hypothetical protein [Mesorhizobium sp. WSM4898]MDG4908126.1 hypothetical protein [Mesorhizobium sp. WSM4898]
MMIFEPLDMRGRKRADLHRAARLALLRGRILKRIGKVDNAAGSVEQATAPFAEAARQTATGLSEC